MRVPHTLLLALAATAVPWSVAAQPAPEGSVTAISQERLVRATAGETREVRSADVGAFAETSTRQQAWMACLPPPQSRCFSGSTTADATQRSLLTTTAAGFLEVRALLSSSSVRTSFSPVPGTALARITSTFAVDGAVSYILQADDSSGTASLVLEDAHGRRVEDVRSAGSIAHEGRLPAGVYTLTAEAASGSSSEWTSSSLDLRFTVGPAASPRTRCTISMTAPRYEFGQVVTASTVGAENRHAGGIPVELKMWLRLPEGHELPVRNVGADGTVTLHAGIPWHFGPVDVMGVTAETPRGLYEFGCRLLNPVTGEQLAEDSELFEVQ
jgi:hypothetical protein